MLAARQEVLDEIGTVVVERVSRQVDFDDQLLGRVRPGDLLLKIEGKDLTPDVNMASLLNDRVGETVSVSVEDDAALWLSCIV